MWYFIEKNISSQLSDAGIPAMEHTIRRPKEVAGTIFQGSYLNEVLEILKMNPDSVKVKERETDDKKIRMIEIVNEGVSEKNLNGKRKEFETNQKKIKKMYLAALKTVFSKKSSMWGYDEYDLSDSLYRFVNELREAHNDMAINYSVEKLSREFGRLWKIPEVKRVKVTRQYLKVTLRVGILKKYRVRIPLFGNRSSQIRIFRALFSIRPEWVYPAHSNYEWGYVCFGNMEDNVHGNLKRGELAALVKMIIIFIDNGVKARFGNRYDRKGIEVWKKKHIFDPIKLIRKLISIRSKKRYIRLMRRASREKRNQMINKINSTRESLTDSCESLIRLYRKRKGLTKISPKEAKKLESKWSEDFDGIISNKDIDFIDVEDSVVKIFTNPISTADEDPVDLGTFKTSLDIHDGGITIENLTDRKEEYDHPIIMDGFPYFDADSWLSIIKLVARVEIPMLINTILGYLQYIDNTLVSPDMWKK